MGGFVPTVRVQREGKGWCSSHLHFIQSCTPAYWIEMPEFMGDLPTSIKPNVETALPIPTNSTSPQVDDQH